MWSIPFQGSGRPSNVESIQVVVLYETATGRIVHREVVTTFAAGRRVPVGEAVASARLQAARVGHPIHLLRAKVSHDPRHATGRHRIDLDTGKFIEVPVPRWQ